MASLAWTLIGTKRSVQGVGAANDTVDQTSFTNWLNLSGVGAFKVYVECVTSNATIGTAFALHAYHQNPVTGRVARAEKYDCTGSTATGDRAVLLGEFTVGSDVGLLAWQPSAGAVSAGNIAIQVIASGKMGYGELL